MSLTHPFPADWRAQVLTGSPLIAPARQFTYPRAVPGEEDALARGAMYVLVKPSSGGEFLATCARGFADPALPSGIWSCPRPQEICLVAGGYACIVDTLAPEQAALVPQRPVTEVVPAVEAGLLLFAGFHTVIAWGANGLAWETGKLTWEGLTLGAVDGNILNGMGWDMMADKEVPFEVDLTTGKHTGGGFRG
ncbi:MAG: hypothetical protein HOQ35_02615 [Acidobacteriaceae bacterium]|nr:hypothetical protein [Acidobacteriaceae bacterium]